MRKILFVIILLLGCFNSKAADYYTLIKSSLSESITDGFQIQLIDSSISSHYILLQASSIENLNSILLNLQEELAQSGLKVSYSKSIDQYRFIVKLPKEQLDSRLQLLLQKFSSNKLSSLEIIVFGPINQQRLLGIINRQYNSIDLTVNPSPEALANENTAVLSPLTTEQANQQQSDWMIGLNTGLINCSYLDSGTFNFYYYQNNKFICNNYSPNHALTDKEVVALKDKLYSDIQLSIETAEGFLSYISSFKSERRLELSQSFFNALPALSIDRILEYHYKKILKVQLEPIQGGTSFDSTSAYQMPTNYKVKTNFSAESSKVVNFDLVINSAYTCVQLNCTSLAALPYIQYSTSEDLHLFSIRYPSFHETTVLSELNKVLFIPLSTSSVIAQEDLLVSLTGGYLLEAYDDSFKLIAKLPLVNTNLDSITHNPINRNILNFNITKDNISRVAIDLHSVPGGQYWEESELLYFIVSSSNIGTSANIRMNKSNSLVNTGLSGRVYLEMNYSPIFVELGYNTPETTEQLVTGLIQFLDEFPKQLSRNEFVEFRKNIITNLRLLDSNSTAAVQLSHMFDLVSPQEMLIQRLENLSYEQFKAYLIENVAYDQVTITTSYDLDESLKEALRNLLNNS